MNGFLEELEKQVRMEAENYLLEKGIMPVTLPDIELELTPETRDLTFDSGKAESYQGALNEVKNREVDELVDELEDHDFDNTGSEWEKDRGVSRKGHFARGTSKSPAEVSVNLTPFDLLPYAAGSAEKTYRNWAEDNLGQEPEEIISQLEPAVDLYPGDTPEETVFCTLQMKAELAQENLQTLPGSVKKIYRQVLSNQKESAVSTAVHEGAHAEFDRHYDLEIPELSEVEKELVEDEIRERRNRYEIVGDSLTSKWGEVIEEVAGRRQADQYREFVRLNGVNEVYARIVEKSYEGADMAELERDDLYEEGSFWGEAGYEGNNPFNEETAPPGDVSGVRVEKLGEYLAENGLDSIFELSSQQVIDRFYTEETV